MNAKLFINYRREDTAPYAGRLYDRLTAHFGEDQVFIDIDQIEPGEDFVEAINRKVGACDIAIVAIGPHWLGATDASGKRRIDDEEDFVRMEIVAALQRNIRVIPVLVGRAQMPRKQELPEALEPLSRRNAIELSETRFHADVNRLIAAIEKAFAVVEKEAELSATPAAFPREPTVVGPPKVESKDATEPFESTKAGEGKEPKEVDGDAILEATPVSLGETTQQFPTQAAPPYLVSERTPQDSVATAQDSTAPVKSTQTPPPIPPVASISTIAALKKPAVWLRKRPIMIAVVGITVILLTITAWPTMSHRLQAVRNAKELADLQKRADQGDASAQDLLGLVYRFGVSPAPNDLTKAAELFQKAADQGNASAQTRLGELYENGEGVPKDLGKAIEFYQKAADQGDQRAIANLKRLSAQSSPAASASATASPSITREPTRVADSPAPKASVALLVNQAEAESFIRSFYRDMEHDDADKVLAYFDETVDYYTYGRKEKAFIAGQLPQYFAAFPNRSFSVGEVRLQTSSTSGSVPVTFEARYSLRSLGQTTASTGRSHVEWDLVKRDGALKIIRFTYTSYPDAFPAGSP